jgi:hypothetical protein
MGALAIGSVLFGIFIGKFFRWPVLVPAFMLVILFILINPAHVERTPQILFCQTAISIVSLQIGYVLGMLALNIDRAPKPPKNLKNRTPNDPRIDWPRIWRDRS